MDLARHGCKQQVHDGDALVERGRLRAGQDRLVRLAGEDVRDLVVVLVLGEELEIEGEVLGDLAILQVLGDERAVDGQALALVG